MRPQDRSSPDESARRVPPLRLLVVLATIAVLPVFLGAAGPPAEFGTYQKLFAADSPWNSRPVAPVLGTDTVPKSDYFPSIAEGAWSTGVFLAKPADPPVVVKGTPDRTGVWDVDAEEFRDITIPHWPADVTPAIEADGHAEIVDPQLNVVHSFWQLRFRDGRWMAAQYGWSRLDGSGWGDPAHYFQGARATGVPTSGGLIRKAEVNDGDTMYRHALAMSMTFNGLSPAPAYVYPATSADGGAASTNTGKIPEGSLMMLPSTFDAQKLSTPELRKVAETLKTYGAYVVDRNVGTPFGIYVEIGSGFELHRGGWSNQVAAELDLIRSELRPLVSSGGWIDGNGRQYVRPADPNLMSMRGPWKTTVGSARARFDDWSQSVVFDAADERAVAVNENGRGFNSVSWGAPIAGNSYRLRAFASGGARLRIEFRDKGTGRILFDTGEVEDNKAVVFRWPANSRPIVYASSGNKGARSSVRGEVIASAGSEAATKAP